MRHMCHARGCETPVPPKLLMCLKHWKLVPSKLQRAVYLHYQPGQESGAYRPTDAWHEAADQAIDAVAKREKALDDERALEGAQGELKL
jgi:hypothetical protein